MELSEAIKKLKETQDSYLKDELDIAIDTVLKALDNSISKDEVIKKIEEQDYCYNSNLERHFKKQVLQELLGD